MNVLSLFDGMSCAQIALNRAGIHYCNYFASEVDKYAIKVTQQNYPDTIQLGDVRNVGPGALPKIQLLCGGSPCQSFSFNGKRLGMKTKSLVDILTLEQYVEYKESGYEFEGESFLFWEYVRLLKELKPKYFILENVKMLEKWEQLISQTLGVNPIEINSALVSAQNRKRLYWTNIGLEPTGLFNIPESIIKQPEDKGIIIRDILEEHVADNYYLKSEIVKNLQNYNDRQIKNGRGFRSKFRDPQTVNKMDTLTIGGTHQKDLIIHNLMPRSSKNGNGGTGHLYKENGKTYCLDTTGAVNAIEFKRNYVQWDQSGKGYNSQQDRAYYDGNKFGALTSSRPETKINILQNRIVRRLTPRECERLQTVPDDYTAHVSNSQRYKMLGNGWTVDVIAHILKHIKK